MKRALVALLIGCASWSFAATFTVNSTADLGDSNPGNGVCRTANSGTAICTLRAAVQEANALAGADTIVFSLAANSTITMTTGTSSSSTNNRRALTISESLTIDGSAVAGLTINGGWNSVSGSDTGWGIFTAPTSATAASRTINLSSLRLINSNPGTASSGTNPGVANSNGGALFVEGGTVNIDRVTFNNGYANDGSAIDLETGTTVNVTNSTFSNGKSRDDGGAIDVSSGGTLNATNTTFAYNQSAFAATSGVGGIGGAIRNSGILNLTYVTVAYNDGDLTGGIATGGTLRVRNSLITGNTARSGGEVNCNGSVTNLGNNWSTENSCGFTNTTTASALALSTTLATNTNSPTNTGPTQTLALAQGSVVNGVISAGTDCGAGAGTTDQRGVTRAVGAGCEPGAYELQGLVVNGAVFSDTNRNGTQDTGENAFTAATVTVTLTNTSTNQTFTTTTTTGAYTFSNVSAGTYSVTAAVPGYSVTTAARTVTVTSSASSTVQAIGLAQTLPPSPCSTLYGGGVAATTTDAGPIFSINTVTGARISDLFTPPYGTAAFARSPINGRIYFIEYTNGTAASRVGYYDPVAGTVNATAATINKGTDSGQFLRFGFNAAGVGYASIADNNSVYTITPSGNTATVARLGTITGLPTGLSGDFAITTANRAWLSGNGEVYRVDLNKPTLPAVTIYNTNNADINGVAFDSNNDLFVSDTVQLYRIDPGTLQQTSVGSGFNITTRSADLANCIIPALEPNLTVVKTVSPTGPVAPSTELTYTITVTNSGNAVAVNTTFQDSIPANTTYVAGSTTKNSVPTPDAEGGLMPFVTAATITSPDVKFGPGIIGTGTTNQATVSFKVTVNNPFPSTATSVTNQGFVEYDSGTGDTRITQPTTPPGGGTGGTPITIGSRDFGDAPDAATGTGAGNYQTTGTDNGPSHTIVSGLRLGSVVADADNGTLQNVSATADDTTGTADEDGVTSFPVLVTTSGQAVTVPVGVTNSTGVAASLVGYLDFNKDGDFLDTGERSATVNVASSGTNPRSFSVSFTVPAGVTAGTTYARFRIGGVSSEVTSSVGAASSGEVEDYRVTIGSPDLTIGKTHSGSFVRGSSGTYTLTVNNSGNQPTSGTITVTDTLPAGLSVNNGAAGTVTTGGANAATWTCSSNAASPQVITCTSTAGTVIATGGNSVFTLTVNVAPSAGTPVVNSVAVSGGSEAAANNGNNTASDSTVTAAPTDLTLSKSHSDDFTVGSVGTYSFTVNNIGGVASSGTITVTDTLPTGLSFVTGSTTGTGWACSASGQTVTCTSSAGIAAASISPFSFSVNVGAGTAPGTNSITNSAAVSGGGDSNTVNNSASDPTTVLSPDLTISKTHTGNFTRGDVGTYTLTVSNTGTASTSSTITVTDTLPAGLSVNGGAAGAVTVGDTNAVNWTCAANAASPQVVTCSSTATIVVSESSTFTLSVDVASGAESSVTNSVAVSGGNEANANSGNNSATDPTPTIAPTDLTLAKTHSGNFTVGKPGTYTLTVTNSGEVASSGTVTVTDTLPVGLTVNSGAAGAVTVGGTNAANWSCSSDAASPQVVTCTSSTAISGGGTSVFTLTVAVGTATAPGTNSITNTAAVSGGGDGNTANNGASKSTTVLSPDLTVTKTHTPGSFIQGGTGNYQIRVNNSNTSTTAATSGTITVTDTLPSGLSVPAGTVTLTSGTGWNCSASGQVITCTRTTAIAKNGNSTFSFNVNVASPAPASVTNQVSVAGENEATARAGNNTATDPTPTVDAGNLTLVKSVRNVTTNSGFSDAGSGEPGDVLEYCVAYSNTGQSPVTNTVVSDTIPITTTPLTSILDYGNQAIRWRITAPTTSTQNLSAPVDADAGELGAVLSVRVGAVPAGGTGDVCFQSRIQ